MRKAPRKELIAAISIPATILSVEGLKYVGHVTLGLSLEEVRETAVVLGLSLGAVVAIDTWWPAKRPSK